MDIELNKQIVLTVRALYFSVCEQWAEVAKKHSLSSAQQHLLFILSSNNNPLTITEISQLGCWHISTVTRLLKPLLDENYISITNGKGRYKFVSLTNLGKQKLKTIADDVFQRTNFPLNAQGIENEDLEQFVEIGSQILRNQRGEEFTNWVQKSQPKAIFS